jgi:hypothetical protein
MATIKEMRDVCQQRRPDAKGRMVWAGHWFNRLVTRWFSIYVTWVFVKLNISANTVSVLMIVSGLAGFALSIPHLLWLNIIGALLLFLGEVLDCCDGEVARWTKRSSLKGVYLDLINHVLCNAPASSICALHLYAIYHQDKYLILAFLAYAMAQIRHGLKEEFYRVSLQLPQKNSPPEHNQNVPWAPRHKSFMGSIIEIIKIMLHKFVDEYIIRIATVAALFLTYAGFEWPMIFLSWWFVIIGFAGNVGDIFYKYFFNIPDSWHVKKV